MTHLNTIDKISYDGKSGYAFTEAGPLVKFTRHHYECTIRKDAIEAVEYRVFRNFGYLLYGWFVLAVFAFRFVNAPEEIQRQMAGNWGVNVQFLLWGFLLSSLLAFAAYYYPNSKLVIHAGSFKCVIDGPDEKLIRIAARLQA